MNDEYIVKWIDHAPPGGFPPEVQSIIDKQAELLRSGIAPPGTLRWVQAKMYDKKIRSLLTQLGYEITETVEATGPEGS